MFDNYWEITEIAKIKEKEIYNKMETRLIAKKMKEVRKPPKLHYIFLDNLGKFFSTFGDSLQSQYHYEIEKNVRKVS